MFDWFKRKPKNEELEATIILPVGLDDRHSYAAPGVPVEHKHPYPSPPQYGATVYATKRGTELPPVAKQDDILVHFMQPPDDQAPQEYYEDRNAVNIALGRQEVFQTKNPLENSTNIAAAPNPWLSTPLSPRATSRMSPSNFRFYRPFDQRWARQLNGVATSLATVGRAYPVGGMQPPKSFRNTFRLAPTARDIENVDLASTTTASVTPAVYVSPQAGARRWSL